MKDEEERGSVEVMEEVDTEKRGMSLAGVSLYYGLLTRACRINAVIFQPEVKAG